MIAWYGIWTCCLWNCCTPLQRVQKVKKTHFPVNQGVGLTGTIFRTKRDCSRQWNLYLHHHWPIGNILVGWKGYRSNQCTSYLGCKRFHVAFKSRKKSSNLLDMTSTGHWSLCFFTDLPTYQMSVDGTGACFYHSMDARGPLWLWNPVDMYDWLQIQA